MKLKSITIKNFKGIDEEGVTIDFAPITLLFGPNNAGKSTIIQALHLAREVFCEPKPDFDRMDKYGKSFNLGSFKDYVHRHDINKIVNIKLDFDEVYGLPNTNIGKYLNKEKDDIPEVDAIASDIESFALEFSIKWNFRSNAPKVSSYSIYLNNSLFTNLTLTPSGNGNDTFVYNDSCRPQPFISKDVWGNFIEFANIHLFEVTSSSTLVEELADTIPPMLLQFTDVGSLLADQNLYYDSDQDFFHISCTLENRSLFEWGKFLEFNFTHHLDDLRTIEEFYENYQFQCNEIFSQFISMTGKMAGDFLDRLLYIGPMREVPPRGMQVPQRITHSRWADGLAAWDAILTAKSEKNSSIDSKLEKLGLNYSIFLRPKVDFEEIQQTIFAAGSNLQEFDKEILDSFYSLIRKGFLQFFKVGNDTTVSEIFPEKINLFEEFAKDTFLETLDKFFEEHFSEENELFQDFKNFMELLDNKNETSNFLDRLRAFIPITTEQQIYLKHTTTKVITEPHDMGLGVSQIIPFIAAMEFAQKNAFIAIEQPELHIHPKLQVNLGDVIIESAKSDKNPLFLIETHSEHLMLRLLRRIRENNENELPEGFPPFTKEDIAVNYIYPDSDGKTLFKKLPVTDDGDFATQWPDGFFDERGEELF